jgi:predicted nucleic acid-binding protein
VIVVDASVVANAVADDGPDGDAIRDRLRDARDLSAPDLVDVETVSALRRRWLAKDLTGRRFRAAVDDLVALPIVRYPTRQLLPRAFELRSNVTPYDAVYVALAEELGRPLFTADLRLARAPGLRCAVEVAGG